MVGITEIKWVNHNEIEDKPIFRYFLFLNWSIKPKNVPIKRIVKIMNFSWVEIKNNCSGDRSHESHEPDVIAMNLRKMMGIKQFIDWWLEVQAWNLIRGLLENRVIRKE